MTAVPSNSDYILEIKTLKSVVIKNLFESIKFLKEANLVFSSDGIKISTLDDTKAICLYLKLDSKKFESYYCKSARRLGINLVLFYKLIKSVTIHDTICLF